MKIFTRIIMMLILACVMHNCQAQPSSSVYLVFKLYDSSGKPVDYKEFCKSYKLLGENDRDDQTPCTNKYLLKEYFFNPETKVFTLGGSVVYNDLFRKFIYKKDTMLLIFETKGGNSTAAYKIDSLVIRPGEYLINDHSLPFIPFDKAAVAYYNQILEWAVYRMKFIQYAESYPYMELNRLRTKYGISLTDYNPKTVVDIFH